MGLHYHGQDLGLKLVAGSWYQAQGWGTGSGLRVHRVACERKTGEHDSFPN